MTEGPQRCENYQKPQPITRISEPTIKITKENLDQALRILKQVLDEEGKV